VNILGVRFKKKIVVSNIYIKLCFKTPGRFFLKTHFCSLSEFGQKNGLGSCHKYAYISETVHLSLFIIIDDIYKVMYCLQFGMFVFDLDQAQALDMAPSCIMQIKWAALPHC
jgi:hypothetical protein